MIELRSILSIRRINSVTYFIFLSSIVGVEVLDDEEDKNKDVIESSEGQRDIKIPICDINLKKNENKTKLIEWFDSRTGIRKC